MKIAQAGVGTAVLALFLAAEVHAQNVGIGVANPQSKLSLNGTTSSGGLAIGDATYTSTTGTVAPQNGAIVQGTVGIGTNAPNSSSQLHIWNDLVLILNEFSFRQLRGCLEGERQGPRMTGGPKA
jgi:hypothetical protein